MRTLRAGSAVYRFTYEEYKVHKTLAELKAENAAAEAENTESEQSEFDEVETEEAEVDEVETEQEESESEEAEESESEGDTESEAWMLPDEQSVESEESEKPDSVPLGTFVETKQKLKGRINEKDSEIQELKKEIEALKTGGTTAQAKEPPKPSRNDFYSDDEYDKALESYYTKKIERERAKLETEQQQKAHQAAIKQSVDAHYNRAAELVSNTGMSPEKYQQADTKVRSIVNSVFEGQGDDITDMLISRLGEGSEKLLARVGISNKEAQAFESALKADKSGLKAMRYFGQLEERMKATRTIKKQSTAPKPGTKINQGGNASTSLKRQYDKAHKNGDISAAIKIKRQAKREKHDVSNW